MSAGAATNRRQRCYIRDAGLLQAKSSLVLLHTAAGGATNRRRVCYIRDAGLLQAIPHRRCYKPSLALLHTSTASATHGFRCCCKPSTPPLLRKAPAPADMNGLWLCYEGHRCCYNLSPAPLNFRNSRQRCFKSDAVVAAAWLRAAASTAAVDARGLVLRASPPSVEVAADGGAPPVAGWFDVQSHAVIFPLELFMRSEVEIGERDEVRDRARRNISRLLVNC
jgi:hypothetical protein